MIEIKPEDVGKKIFDMWTRQWFEISEWQSKYARFMLKLPNTALEQCDTTGSYFGVPRFAWEETPLPELRKRPRGKKKVDLWVGVRCAFGNGLYLTTYAYRTEEQAISALDSYKNSSVHKITIEVDE